MHAVADAQRQCQAVMGLTDARGAQPLTVPGRVRRQEPAREPTRPAPRATTKDTTDRPAAPGRRSRLPDQHRRCGGSLEPVHAVLLAAEAPARTGHRPVPHRRGVGHRAGDRTPPHDPTTPQTPRRSRRARSTVARVTGTGCRADDDPAHGDSAIDLPADSPPSRRRSCAAPPHIGGKRDTWG